jgi:hypothetical protein
MWPTQMAAPTATDLAALPNRLPGGVWTIRKADRTGFANTTRAVPSSHPLQYAARHLKLLVHYLLTRQAIHNALRAHQLRQGR